MFNKLTAHILSEPLTFPLRVYHRLSVIMALTVSPSEEQNICLYYIQSSISCSELFDTFYMKLYFNIKYKLLSIESLIGLNLVQNNCLKTSIILRDLWYKWENCSLRLIARLLSDSHQIWVIESIVYLGLTSTLNSSMFYSVSKWEVESQPKRTDLYLWFFTIIIVCL